MVAQPARNLQSIIPALFTGQGGQLMTPDEVQRQRQIAAALMQSGSDSSPVTHWTQGASRLVDAFNGNRRERQAGEGAARGAAYNRDLISGLLGGMGGGASSFGGGAMPTAGAGAGMAALPSGGGAASVPSGEMASYVRDGLVQRGLPQHVADAFVVNFQDESGLNPGINEAKPLVPGSRGGFGLYQLTGPRRREYEAFASQRGVNPADPDAQLDFLMMELQGSESRAARSILSAPDTATAAQAIVNNFLRPAPEHRTSRARRYANLGGGSQQPVQVASLDPSIGYASALGQGAMRATNQPGAYAPGSIDAPAAEMDPESAARLAALRSPYDPSGNVPAERPGAISDVSGQNYSGQGIPNATPPQAAPNSGSMIAQALTASSPMQAPMQAPTYTPQPYNPPAQAAPQYAPAGINPMIMEALSSPYADDSTRQIAGMLLQQQQGQQAAAAQQAFEMQKLQEQRAYDRWNTLDQRQYERSNSLDDRYWTAGREDRRNAVTDGFERDRIDISRQGLTPTDIREYEYAQRQGYPGTFSEWQLEKTRAGATNVTTNVGEGDQFYKKLDEGQATIFNDLSQAGAQGRSKLAQIDRLETLLGRAPQGASALLKQAAGEYGINTEGLSDIQASQALINELVPQQRQPGSGPMSDADLALFKQSLPRLINQPEGNKLILDTMRGITQYQIQMGEIADQVANREISPADARRKMRELNNPLEGFSDRAGVANGDTIQLDEVDVPADVDPAIWEFMTPEERRLFQ